MKYFKAKKDLIFGDGSVSFTKGKTYQTRNWNGNRVTENTVLVNDQGAIHVAGVWARHFAASSENAFSQQKHE